MTEQELEQKIHDYIKSWYKAEYVGKLTVEKSSGIYKFSIAIPSYMTLTSIAGDFTSDEEFLGFIYEELRKRNYMRVDYYKVVRTDSTILDKPSKKINVSNPIVKQPDENLGFPFIFPFILT